MALKMLFPLLGLLAVLPGAEAQTFPTKPIRLVVPNAPGGNADLVARVAAEALSREFSSSVYVDNIAGGRQVPATQTVIRSAPDGHTLQAIGLGMAVNYSVYKDLPYNTAKDLAPVGMVGVAPQLVVSAPSFAPNNIKELVALAKAKPDTIHYSSAGVGSTGHLGGALLELLAGIKMSHVPYKGTAQANNDTVSGVVELSIASVSSTLPLVKAGKLKVLAISSAKRSPQLPNYPAVAETVPGYELMLWNGIAAPAATPKALVARLNATLNKGLSTPDIKTKLANMGVDAEPMSPEALARYVDDEYKRWAKVVEAAKIEGGGD